MKKPLIILFLFFSLILGQESRENSSNIIKRDGLLYRLDIYLEFGIEKGPYSGEVFEIKPKVTDDYGSYVESEYSVLNGKIHGNHKLWNEFGNLFLETIYRMGKLDGTYILYFSNGQINEQGTFKNGIRNGVFITFEENGKIKSRKTYENGKRK